MINAFQDFKTIINDTRNTFALYDYLHDVVKVPYDYSDLLRWQWAQSVSAMDKLLHDLIKIGMRESFSGFRVPTKAFNAFVIDVATYRLIDQTPLAKEVVFENYVASIHSHKSFQQPKEISKALALIWPEEHKWQAIATQMGTTDTNVTTQLATIVTRRNQIVHQGDYAASSQPRQCIEKADTVRTIDFIEQLGSAIYSLVS